MKIKSEVLDPVTLQLEHDKFFTKRMKSKASK